MTGIFRVNHPRKQVKAAADAHSAAHCAGQRYIYSGSADGCIYMFDTITGEVKHKLKGHQKTVRDCSWHPHNGTLVSVSWDGSILEWGPRPCDGPPAHCTGRSHYRHL